jgi:hypothetical protein
MCMLLDKTVVCAEVTAQWYLVRCKFHVLPHKRNGFRRWEADNWPTEDGQLGRSTNVERYKRTLTQWKNRILGESDAAYFSLLPWQSSGGFDENQETRRTGQEVHGSRLFLAFQFISCTRYRKKLKAQISQFPLLNAYNQTWRWRELFSVCYKQKNWKTKTDELYTPAATQVWVARNVQY